MRDERDIQFFIQRPWRPWLNAWIYEGRGEFYEGPLSTPEMVDVRVRGLGALTQRLGRA